LTKNATLLTFSGRNENTDNSATRLLNVYSSYLFSVSTFQFEQQQQFNYFQFQFQFLYFLPAGLVCIFVREHGVHAGPKDYFVVVVVVIRGSI
jgi:hypothetical protein